VSSIVVCGGGVIGLCAAMMLAREGLEVTVLEADPAEPPAPVDAWTSWTRKGVAQFRQPHNLFGRFRQICDDELPELTDKLLAAGCVWVDYLESLPPGIEDRAPQRGDDRMRFVTGRRPVVESVLAEAAREEPRVTVRRGMRVAELVQGPAAIPGTPHVTGVRTTDGEQIHADLVVDATGRRTPSAKWLAELGAIEPYIESEDCGFVYYTRYFTGPTRPKRTTGALTPYGSFSLLTLDGDNDTWSVTLFAMSGDPPLKMFRFTDRFDRVVQACPLHAHWLDGEPITDVLAMAGVLDRYRRFVVDGRPIVTGYAAVGDAWACTNPSAGRGISVGMIHAQLLLKAVREHLDDPGAFAHAWHEHTEEGVQPFYRNQIAADRARLAEMNASRQGAEAPSQDGPMARLIAAAGSDADAFRALIETVQCLALPQDVFQRPGMMETLEQHGSGQPTSAPGPDREHLVSLLA
jgi:2-polyprenyl-6-methoxyphenol hydroxylase-like FAD-dependent oxidoreductase